MHFYENYLNDCSNIITQNDKNIIYKQQLFNKFNFNLLSRILNFFKDLKLLIYKSFLSNNTKENCLKQTNLEKDYKNDKNKQLKKDLCKKIIINSSIFLISAIIFYFIKNLFILIINLVIMILIYILIYPLINYSFDKLFDKIFY